MVTILWCLIIKLLTLGAVCIQRFIRMSINSFQRQVFKLTLFTDTNIIATAEMDIVTRKNEENRKLSESNLNHIDNKLSELQKFYDGKNVFVTGGTGKDNMIVVIKFEQHHH